ncbi:MAG: HYR domain-containing protein [Verrucomicrobiales bacterium]|nr:HYR domain-containing protein [Verrucomicrobiales bacterium]
MNNPIRRLASRGARRAATLLAMWLGLAVPVVPAATLRWVGPTTGNQAWSAPSNWDGGRLPGPTDDVIIQGEGLSLSVQVTGTFTVRSIDSTATMRIVSDIGNNSHLSVGGPFINRGSLRIEGPRSDRTSTVTVNGTVPLDNRGLILVTREGGGGRRFNGGIANRGRIQIESGTEWVVGNENREFSAIDGRIEASGPLSIVGGRFRVAGGSLTGPIRLFSGEIVSEPTFVEPGIVRVLGAASRLLGNASPALTLWIDTDIGNNTVLSAAAGAFNAGRIVLGSARSDRQSRLVLQEGAFTNRPQGIVEIARDSEGGREIQGFLVNQGLLTTPDYPVLVTGNYQVDGGQVSGDVRFININLAATRSPQAAHALQLFGTETQLYSGVTSNLVLRVISDIGANAVLGFNTNLFRSNLFNPALAASSAETNIPIQGTILLESQRSDRTTTLVVPPGFRLDNRGLVGVLATNEGGRVLRGAVLNRGRLSVARGIHLAVQNNNASFTHAAGRLDIEGSLGIEAGFVAVEGGTAAGDIRLYNATLRVAPTASSPATLRIIGNASRLVSNSSSAMTLLLDTDVGNFTSLATERNAVNLGRIQVHSSRSDRSAALEVSAGFTNAPGATIETLRGQGGDRRVEGLLVNQGTLAASDGIPLPFAGTYQSDGGLVVGDVRFVNTAIVASRVPAQPVELQLFGAGSSAASGGFSNLVLRVISDIGASAVLTLGSNAVNGGAIRLESPRSDRTSTVRGADRVVRNGPYGSIISFAGEGGRRIEGALVNQGLLHLDQHLTVEGAGANHVNEGRIELNNLTLAVGGASFRNVRPGRILGSGELDVRGTSFTNGGFILPGASPGLIRVRGPFTQSETGVLDIEIAGTSGPGTGHDALEVVNGRVTLAGGTLVTRVLGAFVPTAETRFRIISADGGISGRFARTPSLQVLPNRYLQTEYLPNALDLRTLAGVDSTLPPSIVVHPASQEVVENESVAFAISVNGTGPFTYQWRRNGTPIPGANGNTLTLARVLAADFAEYDVVVSNAAGSTSSETARLTQKTTSDNNGGYDYGDAKDPNYPTTQAHGGASQRVLAGFSLGNTIDADDGTLQNADATADGADEDGVTFLDPFVPGQVVQIQVIHSRLGGQNPGRLSAWIDWNDDGDWADAGERVINHQLLANRTNLFQVAVPAGATIGTTSSRFRLYSSQAQGYAGSDDGYGEVEDYNLDIVTGGGSSPGGESTHDFGDAPDSYQTTLAVNGARHLRDPELYLGAARDLEPDGQPSSFALADDLAGVPDDEDGVTGWPILTPNGTATIHVTVVGTGRVDAWIDFGRDGTFLESGDRVMSGVLFSSETKVIVIPVPATAVPGGTFARFRVSRAGVNSPFGEAPNGEVEDYPIVILAPKRDWGDAPANYPTTLKDNGPRHTLVDTFHLGKSIDSEDDGQPNDPSTGDDITPKGDVDDEDGVTFTTPLVPGQTAEVRVEASEAGKLDAWIDFGDNQSWAEPADRVFTARDLVAGINLLVFTVPADAAIGRTFARFRLSRAGVNSYIGDGGEGEVEDHRVVIERDTGCQLGCTGRDFWIAFPGNFAPDALNPVDARLRVGGAAGTVVTVEAPGLGINIVTTIAGTGATITLPPTVDLGALNDAVVSRGIHITATAPVRVHAISQVDHTSDGFLALPTEVVTGDYVVSAYPNMQVGVPEISGTQFAVVATAPNTRVTVTPSVKTGSRIAGIPYSVVLTNAGDVYQLRNTNDAPADLTGTRIEADQPVSVFGGHLCATVNSPSLFYCDYLVEQLLPTERLGSEFFVAPLATRSGGETVRIVAARNNTSVTLGTTTVVLTNRGDVHETLLSAATRIRSDKPVQLTQVASSSDFDDVRNSDPFLVLVPARAHFTTNHTFATGGTNFLTHHVSVVVPSSVTSLTLNGTVLSPSFTNIPSSGYKYAHLTVSQGFHTLSANEAFGAIVYGWSEYESYGWPSCLFFGDTTPPRLVVSTNRVTLTLGSPATDIPCKVRLPDLRAGASVRDNCGMPRDVTISQDPPPGTFLGVGTHEVTLSVEDNRGNLGTTVITVTVVDPNPSAAVSLQCPDDMSVRCEDESGAVVHYNVEALRGCTPIAVECNPPSGSRFPLGTTRVVCRITEPGVTNQVCTFQVTVDCKKTRAVKIGGLKRAEPTPENPDPPAEITVEWDPEDGVILEVTDDLSTWTEVPTAGNRHVIRILKERGKFFRIRARP